MPPFVSQRGERRFGLEIQVIVQSHPPATEDADTVCIARQFSNDYQLFIGLYLSYNLVIPMVATRFDEFS